MHEVIDLSNDAESDADSDIVELSPVVFANTVKQERHTPSRSSATPSSLAANRQGVLHPDLITRNRMLSTKRSIPLSEESDAKRRRLQPHASTRTRSLLLTQEGRAGTSICISLLSDEEEASVPRIKTENVRNSTLCSPYPQRTVELGNDADDGFLDLNDPDVWDPLIVNPEKMDHGEETDHRTESFEPVETPPQQHPDMSKSRWPPITTGSKNVLYDLYRPHNIRSVLPRRRQVICRPTSLPLDFGVHLSRLKLRASFKEAPGSINRIEQKGGWTIIASACVGGNFDEVYDEYNRPGSLMTWHNGFQILPGHQTTVEKTRGGVGLGHVAKQHTVNDVKFDPLSSSFVSSGTDHTVQVWNLQDQCYRKGVKLGQYQSTPYDIVFKPGTSTLAIGERELFIFRLEEETSISSGSSPHSLPPVAAFELSPPGIDSNVGAMVWGSGPTERCLFASSEPIDTNEFVGCHRIFDVGRNTSAIIDAKEAGDALCIDPFGKNLFLATRGSDGRNILRRYDVRTSTANKTAEFDVDQFPSNIEGEINDSMCSPDGIYLALARNDNHVHVYDCRMFRSTRNVLFDYSHDSPSHVAPGYHSYGIVKAQWVTSTSRRLGLISGGADGCVRLWDPLRAAESKKNGIILAEVNSDVAHFSLGDHFKGEHQLIVGDCGGEVSIFDRVW